MNALVKPRVTKEPLQPVKPGEYRPFDEWWIVTCPCLPETSSRQLSWRKAINIAMEHFRNYHSKATR